MKALRILLPFLLVPALLAPGQAPAPAKVLEKFEVMLGNWEGSGTVRMAAGGEALPWTSVSTVKRILGGHFIQDDVRITTGPGMPPLIFRTVYGWDPSTERCMMFSCGNNGEFMMTPVHWTANGALVSTASGQEEDKFFAGRWVTRFTRDGSTFQGERAVADGGFFVHVEGRMKRGGPGFTPAPEDAKAAMAPPRDELKRLESMAGQWSFKGTMIPSPAAPKVDISGRESVHAILGGHVYVAEIIGDEDSSRPDLPAFRGYSYLGWDGNEKCILNVGFNNLGELHTNRAYFQGESRIIFIRSGLMRGAPTAGRTVLELSKAGGEIRVWTDSLAGDEPAKRVFDGTFTRTKT